LAGAWSWPPTPSSAEVKKRVELYLYPTSGPSWPVTGDLYLYIATFGWLQKQKRKIHTHPAVNFPACFRNKLTVAIRFSRNIHVQLTALRYKQLFRQNILYSQLLQADP